MIRNMNSITSISSYNLLLLLLLLLVWPRYQLAAAQPASGSQTDPYPYNRFSPSMVIIIIILIAALFFMGFFSIYIRHCSDPARSDNTVRPLGLAGRSRRAARGLDRAVIEAFPVMEYSEVKGHKIGKGALECAVCLSEFEEDETLRLIPKCDHVFHPECIDEWLASHTTCPVCRADLVPAPGESVHRLGVSGLDIEAQNNVVEPARQEEPPAEPGFMCFSQSMSRNLTFGSRSNRQHRFPRSHSTGHSLVQPGEDMERYTLRLPVEVRKQVLNRASSMVVLPRESSSRRGYRIGGEGSSRGKSLRQLEKFDRGFKSDRWVFSKTPPFLTRVSSILSPKLTTTKDEGVSGQPVPSASTDLGRIPV